MCDETKTTRECGTDARGDEESRYHDASGWSSRARIEQLAEQMRCAGRGVVDGMLRMVPPEVVGHLNNSRKELLLAVRTLIDKELDSIDRCTERARSLHETVGAEEHPAEPSPPPKS